MSKAERAGELVLNAIQCIKKDKPREAVQQFDEAIKCIHYAMEYENYGSTGQHILKQRLNQYKKYVGKLRLKLPPEEPKDQDDDPQPEILYTTATVHSHGITGRDVMVMASDEPDYGHVTPEVIRNGRRPVQHTPDRTLGEDLFQRIPGETEYIHLETAINFAKKATQEDQEDHIAEAFDLYSKAIEFYDLSVKGELTSEASQDHVRPQVDYCRTRVEALSPFVWQDRADYPIDEDVSPDRQSDSASVDHVTDQATLQRRPVAKTNVVGLDLVRATLLNTVKGDNTSFQRILLVGATGTGKTSLVDNMFKDTVGCFYVYRDASILPHLDETVDESISELFEDARQNKPSVIFLDKIDLLYPLGRGSRSNRNSVQHDTNHQLLEQLKDLNGRNEKIVFISATNSPWHIGSEMRDRFDRVVYTSLPTVKERIAIAKLNALNLLHTLTEEDFVTIAHKTEGFTGADIESIMRTAVLSTMKELHEATHFKEVQLGDLTSPAAWTPCSPDDPNAAPMLLSDKVQVHPPEVTMRHVLDSLDDQVCSVTSSEEYRLRHWVFLSGKAPPEQIPSLQQCPDMNKPHLEQYGYRSADPEKEEEVVTEDAVVVAAIATDALKSFGTLRDGDCADMPSFSSITSEIATQTDACALSRMDSGPMAMSIEASLPPQMRYESDMDTLSFQPNSPDEMEALQATSTGITTCCAIDILDRQVERSLYASVKQEQSTTHTVPYSPVQQTQHSSKVDNHGVADERYYVSTSSVHTPTYVAAVEIKQPKVGPTARKSSYVEDSVISQSVQQPVVEEVRLLEEMPTVERLDLNLQQSNAPAPAARPERLPPLRTKPLSEESPLLVTSSKVDEKSPSAVGIQSQVSTLLVEHQVLEELIVDHKVDQEAQNQYKDVGGPRVQPTALTPMKPEVKQETPERPHHLSESGEVGTAVASSETSRDKEQTQMGDLNDDVVYVVADMATWDRLNYRASAEIKGPQLGRAESIQEDSDEVDNSMIHQSDHTVLLPQPECVSADLGHSNHVQDSVGLQSAAGQVAIMSVASGEERTQSVDSEKELADSNQLPVVDMVARLASGVSTGLVWDMSSTMEENIQRGAAKSNRAASADDEQGEAAPITATGPADIQKEQELSEDRLLEEPNALRLRQVKLEAEEEVTTSGPMGAEIKNVKATNSDQVCDPMPSTQTEDIQTVLPDSSVQKEVNEPVEKVALTPMTGSVQTKDDTTLAMTIPQASEDDIKASEDQNQAEKGAAAEVDKVESQSANRVSPASMSESGSRWGLGQ